MNKLYYAVQNKHQDITLKSGSGGMFYALSKYFLSKNGIVYGASFSDDFRNVNIVRCDNIEKIDALLKSKYLMSSVDKSFQLVKKDLEDGKLVLYSGLPCQIHGLKNYLSKNYDNLICVECVCHGTMPAYIWHDYLDSLYITAKKDCTDVNMRDKRLGWNDYGMSIKVDDEEFFERHQDNKYMKAFLSDKYLNKSCYDCKFKNEFSQADLSIGDYWGATESNTPFNKKLGINVVIAHTEKGLNLLNSLDDVDKISLTKEQASKWNGGMSNKINTTPAVYSKNIFNRDNKIAILTLNFNDNIGGVLQSYALQKFLGDNYYNAITIQSHNYWHHLSFVNKLKTRAVTDFSKIKNDYDTYIVGSDQVWRRDFISGKWAECWKSWKPLFLDFAKDWNVNKIAYSASYGNDNFDFEDVMSGVKSCLDKFDAISMREIDATKYIKDLTKKDVITTCDPTMLLTKDDYLNICKDVPKKEGGLFTYILDRTSQIDNIISKSNMSTMTCKNNSVEDWLACYRDCNCVITDSFHGVVFSIIFNKPFICIYNAGRGGSRFNTLIELFNIKDRVVTNQENVDYELLNKSPNVKYDKLVDFSKNFLLSNIENKERKLNMKKVKPVFGIISWFPDAEPARTQRTTRLNKMLLQLQELFGNDINFMIVAQNWKNYELPKEVKNVDIFRYDKLGILGARKKLGEHFLQSDYDYLIMCDDDIVLETDESFTKEYFFDELNRHPRGFVFLQYGWSLTFCAVSKFIYQQSPMSDIDPEKGDGYEDVVWPNLLHYKHKDNEFNLSGIKFVQHHGEYVRELKSTWCNRNTDHRLLHLMSQYHINQFKKGNFVIDKEKAKELLNKYNWFKLAIFRGWCSKKEYDDFMKNFE